jgi:hypothetical protein
MIYKFTITFKASAGMEPVTTIMYVVEAAKRKIEKRLRDGIAMESTDDIAFISQLQNGCVVNRIDGTPAEAEGMTINEVIEQDVEEANRKYYLIGQLSAINTTNVADIQIEAQQ